MRLVTNAKFRNDEYPKLWVTWTQGGNGVAGWEGKVSVWITGSVEVDKTWMIQLGQSAPLGTICCWLNPHAYGSEASAYFDGAGLTERDLQWATNWALAVIQERDFGGSYPELPASIPNESNQKGAKENP